MLMRRMLVLRADRPSRSRDSGAWYDITVSAEGFERRLAGRIETGRHSISDPAMGA